MSIKLDIFSDPVCPWCFIGKTRLDQALAAAPANPFTIEWHPFQLNPDMPAAGMDRHAFLRLRFGGTDGALAAHGPVLDAAAETGLALDLGAITRMPNTLNAHRLIHWAGIEARQGAVVDALFQAYFQHGQDIGDSDVLADIAARCGMERALVARLLDSDADRGDISARDAHARERGISGVPCFIVAGTHVVSGAQPVSLWAEVIAELTGAP